MKQIDIDIVWHSIKELPKKDTKFILCLHEPNYRFTISCVGYDPNLSWKSYCKIFNVIKWGYLDDFTPSYYNKQ